MASVSEAQSKSAFSQNTNGYPNAPTTQSLPILSSSSTAMDPTDDSMDVSQPHTPSMAPPTQSDANANGSRLSDGQSDPGESIRDGSGGQQPVGAAAAAQQPKVVQTAFIHKLYSMLEDQSIQHLISWSTTSESFVMSPSSEFSKVLAQYFKHTNISSFVRQLNMYGFHKVSDVFHTGSPDSPLWEFKHGAGSFKRGDLAGLRDIKRRASRHALIHRDSFSTAGGKPPAPPQPNTAVEPMPDPIEARLNNLEWNQGDLYSRLARTEEAYVAIASKCQLLLDSMTKCHRWTQSLSTQLLHIVPDPDHTVHREIHAMRDDIARHMDHLKTADETYDSFTNNKPAFNLMVEPSTPASPRHGAIDESRRPSLQAVGRPSSFRAAVPQHLQASPRRYGSIGGAGGGYSPTSRPNFPPPSLPLPIPAPPLPPPPPHSTLVHPPLQPPHPLSNMNSPPLSLSRRHTSADIRQQGWQGGQPPGQLNHGSSPYASGQSSSVWPSSPRAPAVGGGDQHLQDTLASYELSRAPTLNVRQPSPPAPHETGGSSITNSFNNISGPGFANPNDAGWQIHSTRPAFRPLETSGPPTRRGSMASNVHALLNPAESSERPGEDDGAEDRKRKRLG